MNVPLAAGDFLAVFGAYNAAVWPAQLALVATALVGLAAAVWRWPFSLRTVHAALAVLWLWAGGVFWIGFFSRVGPAGYVFGSFFLAQGLVFAAAAVRAGREATAARADTRTLTGAVLIAYALVVYPMIGGATGHAYPNGPSFGAPCPVTIFSLGLLLLTGRRVPVQLFLIPLAWSLVGVTAVVRWGVLEDIALPLAGIAATTLFLLDRMRRPRPAPGVGETPAHSGGIRRLH